MPGDILYQEVDESKIEYPASYDHAKRPRPMPSAGEVRGIIGSGGPLPGPESLLGRRIRLDRGRRSAISILDDVVRQVPGLVWFATYNRGLPSQDLKVGLMERDGTRVALGVSP